MSAQAESGKSSQPDSFPSTAKGRATDRLYKAVANYLEVNGGSAIVVGGVQIQEWPLDGPHSFTVGIKITGKKPVFA